MLNDTHRCLKTPFHYCALWIEHRLDLGQRSHFSSSVFLLFNLCTEMIKVQTVLFECCVAVSMNALIFRLPVLLGIIVFRRTPQIWSLSHHFMPRDSVAVCRLVKQPPEPMKVRTYRSGSHTWKEVCVFLADSCYDEDLCWYFKVIATLEWKRSMQDAAVFYLLKG